MLVNADRHEYEIVITTTFRHVNFEREIDLTSSYETAK